MPTQHHRIQVTEDPELAEALRAAAPQNEDRRQELLERLAGHFSEPETAPWDWDALREGKHRAWPIR